MSLSGIRTPSLAALLWCGLAAAQTAGIDGVVMNATTLQPIRRADVILRHLDAATARGNALTVVETDGEGRFQLQKLAAGDYTVEAQRPGFQSRAFRVTLASGNRPIRIRLTPKSVISGRVVDDEGEVVQNAQVSAITQVGSGNAGLRWSVAAVDTTNDRGEFRLWGLPPGRYFVAAQWRQSSRALRRAANSRSWLPTYFPNALSTAEASMVVAAAGQEAGGIEIGLRRGSMHTVTGTVEFPAGTQQKKPVLVALQPKGSESTSYDYQSQTITSTQPAFRFESVRDGSWMITATTFEGEPLMRTSLPLEVSGEVTDVTLSLQPAAQIRGKAQIEGGKRGDFTRVGVNFDPEEQGQLSLLPAKLDDQGAMSGQLAAPGRYRVRVNGQPTQDSYLHSVRFGSQQVLGSVLEVAGGTLPPITLEFRDDGGRLAGSLESAEEDEEYAVVLLHEDAALRRALPIPDVFVVRGQFEFRGLRPGVYFVVAVSAEKRGMLDWPETLAALPQFATRVDVPAGASMQLNLKPVSLPR